MSNKLYIAGAFVMLIVAIWLGGYFAGKQSCRNDYDRAQAKVLQADSKKSLELEARHEVRTTQTREIVKVIQADPSECGNSRASDAFLDGMRRKGVAPRPAPAPGLHRPQAAGGTPEGRGAMGAGSG